MSKITYDQVCRILNELRASVDEHYNKLIADLPEDERFDAVAGNYEFESITASQQIDSVIEMLDTFGILK